MYIQCEKRFKIEKWLQNYYKIEKSKNVRKIRIFWATKMVHTKKLTPAYPWKIGMCPPPKKILRSPLIVVVVVVMPSTRK